MSYWIFKVNPNQYRLDERLLDSSPKITLQVTRYHERIQKNDIVFIWRAGTPRGICAVMMVDICPYEPEPQDLNDGFELPPGSRARGSEHWAKGRLVQRFPIIDISVIKKIHGLELFSFFSAFQEAINYTVTRSEGAILMEFIEKHQVEAHETGLRPVAKPRASAIGRASNTIKNKTTRPSTNVALLKCEACGRLVVSSDTERHIRENHAGQPVEWGKVK